LIEWLDEFFVTAYLDSVPAVRLRPDVKGASAVYSAMHGVGGETLLLAFERAGLPEYEVAPLSQADDALALGALVALALAAGQRQRDLRDGLRRQLRQHVGAAPSELDLALPSA